MQICDCYFTFSTFLCNFDNSFKFLPDFENFSTLFSVIGIIVLNFAVSGLFLYNFAIPVLFLRNCAVFTSAFSTFLPNFALFSLFSQFFGYYLSSSIVCVISHFLLYCYLISTIFFQFLRDFRIFCSFTFF